MAENAHDLYNQGEKLKDEGKYPEAIEKFEQAVAVDESFALAHFALGVAYGKVGQHDLAVKHAERACQLEPEDPFSYTALSVTYQRAFAGTQDRRYIHMAEDAMARAHALQAGL
ncbi:MAG: tetratricopeptide repeat protein [Planctomycetaceae bacterium]|nr:MAG: tetratricopeptide repeat protein [Planctomycetaceae bacterium]